MISDLTTINIDILLRKMRESIAGCSPHGVARPMWVGDMNDLIRLIEWQRAQIEAMTPVAMPVLDVTIASTETTT